MWELSPAYDLVPVQIILPQDTEELALTLNGKKRKLNHNDFESLGSSLKLNAIQIKKAIQRISNSLEKFLPETLENSFLPNEMQCAIRNLIIGRINRIKE
jgi:serine/threonine-protein kinase HipA